MASLVSATDENGYLTTDLARIVVFVRVATGVAAIGFPLHVSYGVPTTNDVRR